MSANEEKIDLVKALREYDNALYGEYGRGVIFVEKGGMYGIINLQGEEIIACKHREYSDAYGEWKENGFSTIKKELISEADTANYELKRILKDTRQELIQSGEVKELSFYNDMIVNGAVIVKLENGSIGIAAAVIGYNSERNKMLEIKNAFGEHIAFISEPELMKGEKIPYLKICSDENNLYVGSYGNEYSFLASYKMGNFTLEWKIPMYGARIQSIAVNDEHLVAFDMEDGNIKYFNKKNGEYDSSKNISTADQYSKAHHNLAITNESILSGVPGLSFGINDGLLDFHNQIKTYDNTSGELIKEKSVPISIDTLNTVAVDKKNGRTYLAFDDKIGVFSSNGYEGMLLAPTRNILEVNVDKETGCLLVSMKDGKGKVDIYSPHAINKLLLISQINDKTRKFLGEGINPQSEIENKAKNRNLFK